MSGTVRIIPSDKVFFAAGRESILDAALHAGLSLDYGCSNGNCGMCKGRLISGKVQRVRYHDYVVNEAEKSMGCVLLCSYAPAGDIVVEANAAIDSHDIPAQKISAKLKSMLPLNDEVVSLHLQTPRTHRLRFLAGQSVALKLASGRLFVYPIASCPCDDRNIEFHFRKDPNSELLLELLQLSHGATLKVEGPTGAFTLGALDNKHLVFVAWDIGFAPIKSLIEHALQQELNNELHLHYLLPVGSEPYLRNVVRAWDDAFDQFSYEPVFLPFDHQDAAADLANGGVRFCESIEPQIHKLLPSKSCSIYIAGPEPVPELVRPMFVRAGIPEDQIKIAVINRLS